MNRKQTKKLEREKINEELENQKGTRGGTQGAIRIKKGTFKTFGRLLKYFGKENVIKLLFILACLLVIALISVKSSLFLGTIIDDYITPLSSQANPDYSGLAKAILYMAALYIISIVISLVYRLVMTGVSNGVLVNIRTSLFNHMESLPISYFDTHKYGDLMSRFTNDIDNIRSLISDSIPEVFSSCITIVSVLTAMFKISWKLVLVVLASVVLMYLCTVLIGGQSSKYFALRQRSLGDLNAFVEESLNGQKVIKVFCHEESSKAQFDVKNKEHFRQSVLANMFSNILMPINVALGNVQYVVLAIVGGYIAIYKPEEGLTLGMLASFLTLSKNFNRPVTMVSQQINSFVMALAGARRVFAVIDTPSEVDDGYVTLVNAEEKEDGTLVEADHHTGIWAWKYPHHDGRLEYIKVRGDVRLSDVDFSYVPDKQILYDVSVYAEPGQKVAFVGSTGAGKTTITNLINRFYDIEDGKIRFDGINVTKIKKDDLRRSLGIVLQDTNLFTGTIADNIRYGRLDATDDEVIAAAKLANAHSFIEKLPDGYNTVISGTGSELSQGQCQLLAIARCAIADPPVMILDEATSSIDTRTETLVQQGMDRLMSGRTTFVIAHRLSTVQNADAIMVVEGGHIIERGSHDELIAQQGRYYQLYTGKTA